MNFCWDPGIFKVLGIKFCTDTDCISEINYEDTLLDYYFKKREKKKKKEEDTSKVRV